MTRKNHTTPAFVVGLDIGYSNVKRVDGYADAADPTQSIRPAQAAPLHSLNGNATLKEGEHYVQLDGEPWAAFLSAGRAGVTRELHADYPASKAYRALFNASISEACGEGRNEIDHLITGLPVSQMRQPQLVERLTAQLTGTHQVAPQREIQVHKVSVLPQPVGTLNYIYSTYEATDDLDEGVILVLDPGFFSVDWVVFRRGDIVRDSSDSSMEAMSALLEAINQAIAREFGGPGPGREKIEIALQRGKPYIQLYGSKVELKPFVDQAVATVVPKALSNMKQQMRFLDGEAIDFVLMGGGGGGFYQAAAEEIFPLSKVITADRPIISNAFGYWLQHQ